MALLTLADLEGRFVRLDDAPAGATFSFDDPRCAPLSGHFGPTAGAEASTGVAFGDPQSPAMFEATLDAMASSQAARARLVRAKADASACPAVTGTFGDETVEYDVEVSTVVGLGDSAFRVVLVPTSSGHAGYVSTFLLAQSEDVLLSTSFYSVAPEEAADVTAYAIDKVESVLKTGR